MANDDDLVEIITKTELFWILAIKSNDRLIICLYPGEYVLSNILAEKDNLIENIFSGIFI